MKNKTYSNGEVIILWQADKCTHASVCVRTLPNVYDPKSRPWITPENTSGKEIIAQVAQCSSGDLSIVNE